MAAQTETAPALDNNGGFGHFDGFSSSESTHVNNAEFDAEVPRGSNSNHGTDEWDASKVPPSRFQKRKGSIYAVPASRDGHVERNRDATDAFHEAHRKRFSFSKNKDSKDAKEARKNSK